MSGPVTCHVSEETQSVSSISHRIMFEANEVFAFVTKSLKHKLVNIFFRRALQ